MIFLTNYHFKIKNLEVHYLIKQPFKIFHIMDFYIISQIIVTTIAATSAMTLFSYVVSASARELYKEPVLLTYVLASLNIEITLKTKVILSWILHYIIGLFFIVVYHIFWFYDFAALSWLSAFLFGFASGIIGILGWIFLFEIVPKKPNIDFKGYYIQLLIAHIIFGLAGFAVYRLFI